MKLFIFPLLIITGYYFSMELLNTYNTKKDREMFLKTYEIVVECRKDMAIGSADKVCGQLPVFVNEVK